MPFFTHADFKLREIHRQALESLIIRQAQPRSSHACPCQGRQRSLRQLMCNTRSEISDGFTYQGLFTLSSLRYLRTTPWQMKSSTRQFSGS